MDQYTDMKYVATIIMHKVIKKFQHPNVMMLIAVCQLMREANLLGTLYTSYVTCVQCSQQFNYSYNRMVIMINAIMLL